MITTSCTMGFITCKFPYTVLQISKEDIDYLRLVKNVEDTAKSEFLREYEELKEYPPRLSLKVIRTPHEVQQDLVTEVSVDGVDPSVAFDIFARAPPGK